MCALPVPRDVIRAGRESGLALHTQHLRLLEVLVRRRHEGGGPLDADTLALAMDSRAVEPERLVPTRVTPLRKALAPYGFGIMNYRNVGYRLFELV